MNRLVTIPFSHFCEKARWALDRAGVPYVERGYLPLLHAVPALRAGGRRTVPVLVTAREVLNDSTDILRWCDRQGGRLFPDGPDGAEVAALEERFDRELGPDTRRVAYHHLLPAPGAAALIAEVAPSRAQALALRASFPVARALMTRGLRLDAASTARSLARVDALFAELGQRLAGRRYLVGDAFTAADLTFAALAAPLVMPPAYAAYLPPLERMPPALIAIVERLRATGAGRHALTVYERDR